jgi:NAD(P)-dependent dehydrogenase (short-subunit alcohol dehydrogenase family)
MLTVANSGIGFEVANQLLADGAFHVLLGARSIEKGQAAIKDLQSRNLPGTAELVQLDVANEDSVAAAAKLVEEKHGRHVYNYSPKHDPFIIFSIGAFHSSAN